MGLVGLVAVLLTVVWGCVVLMKRARGQDVGTLGFGVFDELFHPAAHHASVVTAEQQESAAPLPAPDD